MIVDRNNQMIVEFNSTPEFNINAVERAKNMRLEFDFRKYCNDDLPLLERNMTPD